MGDRQDDDGEGALNYSIAEAALHTYVRTYSVGGGRAVEVEGKEERGIARERERNDLFTIALVHVD